MKSAILKTEALCWLRFGKQLDYVCTEGGHWSSDVLAACPTYSIEVEVKVSKADLLAEFRNKLSKHAYYTNNQPRWTPSYFYFLVPPDLGEVAVEIVKEKFPRAGVLTVPKRFRSGQGELVSLKKATRLHDKPPSEDMLRAIRRRMSSELCGLHLAIDQLPYTEIEALEDLKKQIVESVVRAQGAADWEKVDEGATGSSGGSGVHLSGVRGDPPTGVAAPETLREDDK